jgi:ubiquinone/menaquinone biosynthesis C-methylase UbiE
VDRLLELTSRAETAHFWFRGFRRFVTPVLREAARGRTDLRLLDCGCGTGYNLSLLTPYGRAYGFDITASGLNLARRARRPLLRADITAIPLCSNRFDIVTSFDVLQCVPDDARAVGEMARVLKPGGVLMLTLAAFEFLRGDHSAFAEEVRRYTRASARRLVEGAALEAERVTYTFGSVLPIVIVTRAAQRALRLARTPTGEFDITVPPAPVNALLTALVRGEAALARRVSMPVGSSLLVVARKAG